MCDNSKSDIKHVREAVEIPIFPARITALVLGAILLIGTLGALKVTMVEDLTSLLPNHKDARTSMIAMSRRWGMMKKVVVVAGPFEPSSERLHSVCDALAKSLVRVDGIRSVFSRIDMAETKKAAEVIMKSAGRLGGLDKQGLKEKGIENRLALLKARLATPEALITQEYLLLDPLGLSRHALSGLEAAGKSLGAVIERGHMLSSDRRHALIVLEIDFNPLDITRSTRFLSDLDASIQKTLKTGVDNLNVIPLGGVHFAVKSARAIKKDVRFAFILTPILVAVIFISFLRRIRFLPAALLPSGVGIVAALGVMGILGEELHALTLGFAATITGVGVDYAIHLLHRAGNERGGSSKEKMGKALKSVTRPVVLGCLTTLGAFLLIATSSFTGIRQMALFASVSVPVAMLVTIFGLPAFHGFLIGKAKRVQDTWSSRFISTVIEGGSKTKRRVVTAIVFVGIGGICLVLTTNVSLSGDPRDLAQPDAELAKKDEEVRKIFPGISRQALIMAQGDSLEEALQANDALYERLTGAGVDKGDIVSVSPFLPSVKTQERSLEWVKELFSQEASDTNMKNKFLEAGFKESYFNEIKGIPDTPKIELNSFKGTSLEPILNDTVKRSDGQFYVLTRVLAKDDDAISRLDKITNIVNGCHLVSERLDAIEALNAFQKELIRMLATWLGAALVLLSISERSIFFGLRAILPAVFGVTGAIGLFGLTGRPLTPVASAGVTLVMGLGIDYGIFVLSKKAHPLALTIRAVVASALTTMAAFGVLAFSETQAMADLGLITLAGIFAALITALFLLPAINRARVQAAILAAVMLFITTACGATGPTTERASSVPGPVKMRHQIMFSQGEDVHVFEGYMILSGEKLLVKAFAGPGVDLFTIVRNGVKHSEDLHIEGLHDKIDIVAVGADIARVYLGGCDKQQAGSADCDFFGERMFEVKDEEGLLTERRFPLAHGIGLNIAYEEYADHSGQLQPEKITLIWGNSKNSMVIRLIAFETLEHVSPDVFEIP